MAKHLKKQKNNKMVIILRIIFVIIFIISLIQIVKWLKENEENKEITHEISKTITIDDIEDVAKYNVNFEKFKKINSDAKAWLKVN